MLKISLLGVALALGLGVLAVSTTPKPAFAACDAVSTCGDAFRDASRSIYNNQGSDTRSVVDRVKDAGDSMKTCWNCAKDQMTSGMDSIRTPNTAETHSTH